MPLASQPTGMASWIIHDLLELTLGICIRSKTLNLSNAIETWRTPCNMQAKKYLSSWIVQDLELALEIVFGQKQ
ncbi:hypothetical protein NC653_038231 [Populus alba x Populus x berolinensis]|uniref:Uncharacterized protein n=1 Tax=Populus alba x Populus x berolinensis TaxID=444605 RepID=A0AAD6LGA2_9ROSI|nr:hypothetical protein NC653_038231 [Populus alba x Populus x berolinensis]